MACGEKPAYGYRRVTWWLRRKENLPVNRKRVLRVMRERGLLVRSRRLRARRKKEWGRVEAAEPNQIWQSDMTKIWAGPAVGWAYLVCVIDCCTREIVGWNLSHRCRTEDALAAVEQVGTRTAARGQPPGERDADHRQRHAVHFFPVHRDPEPAEHHASTHGVSSPGRQQLHRTVPSQPEGRRSLDGGVSKLGRSANSASLAGSRSTITTGLTAEFKIALRTRPSWVLQLT